MAIDTFLFLDDRLRLGMHAFAPLPAHDDAEAQAVETLIPSPLSVHRYLTVHANDAVDPSRYVLRHRCGACGQSSPYSHYHDTAYALLLDNMKDGRSYPMAVCGFTPHHHDRILISQLQALPRTAPPASAAHCLRVDGGAVLGAVRFERLLVHAMGDWAFIHGARQLLIQPARENRYYMHNPEEGSGWEHKNARLRVRYDDTARALHFTPPTAEFPYWSRDISTWRFHPGWSPEQRT